jgi:energy-coupling factor transport system ATP-binding protein
VIRLESVTYRYAGAARPSLHDIDLELPDGAVIGLAGASESGKSTLCLAVSGLAPRAIRGTLEGRLHIDGADVTSRPMHGLASLVGIAFQHPATQLSGVTDTVFEEVAFTPMNLGLPRDEVLERTWAALDALRITGLASREPARLSGGQMQLVAMAGLLAMRPRHLVLDEPTAQLDPAGTTLVADAIAALATDGTSILIAEQKTDLLARVCSRVVVLEAGRIVLHGPAAAVLGDPKLEDLGVPIPSEVLLRRALEAAGLPGGLPDDALRASPA